MPTHAAAVSPAKGKPFEVQSRPTPTPGPGELLIAVKSVAINPADGHMRNVGLFIPTYPTVVGFDIAGLVLEVGENVPTSSDAEDAGPSFQPGITRVAAYAASFWRSCNPDYGAFQERCIVPWQHAVPIPDSGMSWNHMATLPVSVQVPLSAWDALGILPVREPTPSHHANTKEQMQNGNKKQEALLIWGASSSVGTMGVQTARVLRGDGNTSIAAVYATAGSANSDYVASLGADRVFDYKDPQVIEKIVSAARQDNLVIRHCFLATGALALCQDVLKAFTGDGKEGEVTKAKIGSAPILPSDMESVDGVDVIFLMPAAEENERLKQFQYWMGTWLREKLVKGVIRPSPEPKVLGKGLGFINDGLDLVLQGVSCTKLVVEIEE